MDWMYSGARGSCLRALAAASLLLAALAACGDDTPPSAPDASSEDANDLGPDAGPDGAEPADAATDAERPDPSVPDARVDAGDASLDAAPDGGDASAPPPISQYCGDAIRDPVTEECDDGPGEELDVCASDCRVRDVVLGGPRRDADAGAPSIERGLGSAPRVAACGEEGALFVYTEAAPTLQVYAQRLDRWGDFVGGPLSISEGGRPTADADPTVAVLPEGRFAVAWVDASRATPDVLIRLVDLHDGLLGAPRPLHDSRRGPQEAPALLWTGDETLLAVWTDALRVKWRELDASLSPRGDSGFVQPGDTLQTGASLARWASSWAVGWRQVETDGLESVHVLASGQTWHTPPAPPGPAGERPALLPLDDDHLLLVHTVGTDPSGTGTASIGRLRAALLGRDEAGLVESAPWPVRTAPYDGDPALRQGRPSAVAVGEQLLLSWSNDSPRADGLAREALLQQLAWSATDRTVEIAEETHLALAGPQLGDQHNPKLAACPLLPSGALLALWEDDADDLMSGASPEIALGFRPSPFVSLPVEDRRQ